MTTTASPCPTPPRLAYALTEPGRFVIEINRLLLAHPFLRRARGGDGHPVMVLPGFLGADGSTAALRYYIANWGYDTHGWAMGRNLGLRAEDPEFENRLAERLGTLVRKSGRKVSLVGWSLGGLFALYGAHQAPECVRQVITLGSPVSVDPEGSQSPLLLKALYRLIAHPMGTGAHAMQPRAKVLRQKLPVPMSCLYSLSDGVVPPQEATIEGDPALHENIRIPGSHIGLGFNPMVLWLVAERLSQAEGAWRPFEPQGAPGWLYRMLTHEALPI